MVIPTSWTRKWDLSRVPQSRNDRNPASSAHIHSPASALLEPTSSTQDTYYPWEGLEGGSPQKESFFFLKKFLCIYLFIEAAPSGMWDLVPPPGTETVPPAVEMDQ